MLFAEVLLSLEDVVTTFGIISPLFTLKNYPVRASYLLRGSSAPTIDVCVTSCGEAAEIVANTLAATIEQDYPSECFRVLLLDDGRDPKLEAAAKLLAEERRSEGPQVLYRARQHTPHERSFFKAGNLQYGLRETEKLGASQYFAVLDADMIAQPDWLRRMIPHLIVDDKTALACPPQVSLIISFLSIADILSKRFSNFKTSLRS